MIFAYEEEGNQEGNSLNFIFTPLLLASRLVEPAAANVAHPLDHIVVIVVQFALKHLQVADLQTGGGERDLKVHRNGRAVPLLLRVRKEEFNLGAQLRLLHAGHAFDSVKKEFKKSSKRSSKSGVLTSKQ